MENNPYQPPEADLDSITAPALVNAEMLRKEHLNHEASIKSIGLLYFIGAIALVILGISSIIGIDSAAPDLAVASAALLVVLGVLYLWIGTGLRKLKRSVRNIAGVFATLGLIGFPVGTLINGYILYLLFSKKGTVVFSNEYRRVIESTPNIKYKTSIIVWIFVALLIALVGMAVVVPMLNK